MNQPRGRKRPPATELRRRLAAAHLLAMAEDVAKSCSVPLNAVLEGDRHRASALARRRCWQIIRETTDLSLPEVGYLFGVDHTSVRAGVILALRETRPPVCRALWVDEGGRTARCVPAEQRCPLDAPLARTLPFPDLVVPARSA